MASRSRHGKAATERESLLRCARAAAECRYIRRYGLTPDLGYLDSESDERLRTIVRNFYGTDDVARIALEGPFLVA